MMNKCACLCIYSVTKMRKPLGVIHKLFQDSYPHCYFYCRTNYSQKIAQLLLALLSNSWHVSTSPSVFAGITPIIITGEMHCFLLSEDTRL